MRKKTIEPCIECGTAGGKVGGKNCVSPGRIRGRCVRCNNRIKRRRASERRHEAPKAPPPCVGCGTTGGKSSVHLRCAVRPPFRSKDGLCMSCKGKQTRRARLLSRKPAPCRSCGTEGGAASKITGVPSRWGGHCRRCYSRIAGRIVRSRQRRERELRAQAARERREQERERKEVVARTAVERRLKEPVRLPVEPAHAAKRPLASRVTRAYRRATAWWGEPIRARADELRKEAG